MTPEKAAFDNALVDSLLAEITPPEPEQGTTIIPRRALRIDLGGMPQMSPEARKEYDDLQARKRAAMGNPAGDRIRSIFQNR